MLEINILIRENKGIYLLEYEGDNDFLRSKNQGLVAVRATSIKLQNPVNELFTGFLNFSSNIPVT